MDLNDEQYEDNLGIVIVKDHAQNNAPRKKITIRIPSTYDGDQILTWDNQTKIKIYTQASQGNEIVMGTNNSFSSSTSTDLWIEGISASDSMGDITLTLSTQGISPPVTDEIKATVLEVTVTGKYDNQLSDDNERRDSIKDDYYVPHDYNIGSHLIILRDRMVGKSFSVEIKGAILPNDFVDTFGKLKMVRYRPENSYIYSGNGGTST